MRILIVAIMGSVLASQIAAEDRAAATSGKRILWTTNHVQGTPDPPSPYQPQVAFPHLKFVEPLAFAILPGSNRLVIGERAGKIYAFENHPAVARKDLLIDIGRPIMGLAVDPQFAKTGYVFVSNLIATGNPASPRRLRVSRYKIDPTTLRGTPESEMTFLEWKADGHTGGCLRFGPDGYLYVAVGDSSGIADQLKTGQDISDLAASILRIDVRKAKSNRPYSIPNDNPFVKHEGARSEIWAYGLRQAWRFSFDREGQLWAGDVGQDLWESVHLVTKGGNYGWSVKEGTHDFRPERKKGPTPILSPIVEHPHSDFRSVTGGFVYYGDRLKELKGAYIYGDYDTGKIWSFRYRNGKVTEHQELSDTQIRLVAFGQGQRGEVYMLDFADGHIHELAKSPPPPKDAPDFPRKLSETGLFASTKDHIPAPGLIPYTVNARLWSDGATKDRFIALPGDTQIEFEAVVYPQPAPGSLPGWRFPDGTVLVKTFSLEMEVGNPKSVRRLETRILHHERMPGKDDEYGAQVWHGYTYVWNDTQTDAELLDAKGLDRTYTISDKNSPNGKRQQKWHFPSRAECTLCHTMAAKYVLGVTTAQLNKLHEYSDGHKVNQLTRLQELGIFKKPLPAKPAKLAKVVDYDDESQNLNDRARSYLQANCSHCHRKWGGGNAEFQLLHALDLKDTGTVNVRPGQGRFKLNDPRYVVPGEPERSMILYRMQLTGLGRMPHIASDVVDQGAVDLIREWIRKLPRQ